MTQIYLYLRKISCTNELFFILIFKSLSSRILFQDKVFYVRKMCLWRNDKYALDNFPIPLRFGETFFITITGRNVSLTVQKHSFILLSSCLVFSNLCLFLQHFFSDYAKSRFSCKFIDAFLLI